MRASLRIAGVAAVLAGIGLTGGMLAARSGEAERAAREAMAPTGAPVIVVGHRGTVKHAPENTLAAHDAAIARGATLIEMDVRMTKDGEWVIMHDPIVNRTTDGAGLVSQMTLAEIKALDAGSWFSAEFAGERVPTLREALRNIKGRAAVDIDFKSGPADSAARLAALLDEEGFDEGPLVTVFARSWHYDKLRGLPSRYVLRPHYQNARWADIAVERDGVRVMGLRKRDFSFLAAHDIAERGVALFANTMGKHDNADGYSASLRAGARFIQTDDLEGLVAFLDERGLRQTCVPAPDLSCWTEDGAGARYAAVSGRNPARMAASDKGGVSNSATAGGAFGSR
jgi:glycerophosphoryl diester phosphodiesterase